MSELRYSSIFEQYYRGARWRSLKERLSPGEVNVRDLPREDEAVVADWLEGNPTLVLRLKASRLGCIAWLGPALKRRAGWFSHLPARHADIRANQVHLALKEFCESVYGTQALVHVLPDIHFYCTRRGLRSFPSDHLRRATLDSAPAIARWLVHEGELYECDPSYILDNGPAYTWFEEGRPVGFASVHRSEMQDKVGNVGNVFVLPAYRGRGIGKAVVAAVAEGLLDEGRLPVYGCSADNLASAGTAEGAGFRFAGCNYRVYVAPDAGTG